MWWCLHDQAELTQLFREMDMSMKLVHDLVKQKISVQHLKKMSREDLKSLGFVLGEAISLETHFASL
jgi:hypothetical protein